MERQGREGDDGVGEVDGVEKGGRCRFAPFAVVLVLGAAVGIIGRGLGVTTAARGGSSVNEIKG